MQAVAQTEFLTFGGHELVSAISGPEQSVKLADAVVGTRLGSLSGVPLPA